MALLFARLNTFIQQKGAPVHECLHSSQVLSFKNKLADLFIFFKKKLKIKAGGIFFYITDASYLTVCDSLLN